MSDWVPIVTVKRSVRSVCVIALLCLLKEKSGFKKRKERTQKIHSKRNECLIRSKKRIEFFPP